MKTIFCKFLDGRDKNGAITIKPLGIAKNNVSKPTLPGWKDVETQIEIDEAYTDGLDGIEEYSHVIIVYWMDKEAECHLKHYPQGREDVPFIGIFACRCPQRPNRIAISTVELLSRNGNIFKVKGLDIVDGTPILDVKPYTPQYDEVRKAKVPQWVSRLVFFVTLFILLFSVSGTPVRAQATPSTDNHTAREETEGKEIWEKFQAKQLECKNFTDDDFAVLGEYFMGQSIGDTQKHALMNQMMVSMMGEQGEEQMHVIMGKRLSGCDTSAALPQNGVGFMPMMWMMGGGGNPMMGTGWGNMMGGWNGFGVFGWLSMLLFWILLILGVVALLRYLGRSGQSQENKTPLEILKERYAHGEINKKEFEEKKKDLL